MNRMQMIGLTGPAGAGKDTVADLLATHARFCKLSFADPLRAELADAFGTTFDAFAQRATKEEPAERFALQRCLDNGFVGAMVTHYRETRPPEPLEAFLTAPRSPRQLMRWWGTEYRRANDAHYWTRALAARVKARADGGQTRFVITDVRFHNEAKLVRQHGGSIWQVTRPGLALDTSHVSEVDGSAFAPDARINNLHDIRHLQHVVLAHWLYDENSLSRDDLIAMGQTLERVSV